MGRRMSSEKERGVNPGTSRGAKARSKSLSKASSECRGFLNGVDGIAI